MFEQIIEYKNHDNLYFVVPKSGVYNVRQNYFTFAISHQYTQLNFGENLYSTVIMNSKLVDQDECSRLLESVEFTEERQFENTEWQKIEVYQPSNLPAGANLETDVAYNIFSGEIDQSNLPFNDLFFDTSSEYPLNFQSMCYEGEIPDLGSNTEP